MSSKETLDKAYGNMPKEVGFSVDWGFIPSWRGVKYYWYKLVRKMQGRGRCDCGHSH
jgi:hypothetical protein